MSTTVRWLSAALALFLFTFIGTRADAADMAGALKYVPKDAIIVGGVDVDALKKSGLVDRAMKMALAQLSSSDTAEYATFKKETGFDPQRDLKGITRRLGYIASLGVDAVWLSPFFKSPMADMGYDVSDYCAVDPMFGTLADFDEMIAEAHRLGLKIIIDQVLSHSSDRHPWFVESRSSRTNAKADWYVWADPKPDGSAPNNWLSIFGGPAWEWDSVRKQYYLHNFLASQPDLNFHNPGVQDALLATVKFWLDRGVDGFRLDTVNYYVHDRHLRDNPPLKISASTS